MYKPGMDFMWSAFPFIFAGVFILVVAAMIVSVIRSVKNSEAARLLRLARQQQLEEEALGGPSAPRSLSNMETVYRPILAKDFPDLNLDELKGHAQAVFTKTLQALERRDRQAIPLCDTTYMEQLRADLDRLDELGRTLSFRDLRVHKVVLNSYEKVDGLCRLRFQLAYRAEVLERELGENLRKSVQTVSELRGELDMIYIQDLAKVPTELQTGVALNCPNCGAALDESGATRCRYCGSPVRPLNLRVWRFSHYVRDF